MKGPRQARGFAEMVLGLETQLDLLEENSRRAFERGDEAYLPEVAAKLRILLVRSRNNTPLLFEVAAQIAHSPQITLDGPPILKRPGEIGPGDTVTLDEFFDLQAVTIRTSEGLVTLTKRELIRAWAEQLGGVHEDWSVDESLLNAVRFPMRVMGMQPTVMELRNCALATLRHGRQLVSLARQRLQET